MPYYVRRRCPTGTFLYTVQRGDTLNKLAEQYNTTVLALVSVNPMIDPDYLLIGQNICIPQRPAYPTCPQGNYYRIKSGDTLYKIAKYYNISLDDLVEANPSIDPDKLAVGQTICIPLATPPVTCQGQATHTIEEGDTLYQIAQMHNVTVGQLLNANPGINPRALLVGQVICIPD